MSGNAVILRGGSEAVHSNRALHAAFAAGLVTAGLSADAVQLVPTQERAAVGAMLRAQGLIDIIIPRGGKGLVARVQEIGRALCRERVGQDGEISVVAVTLKKKTQTVSYKNSIT